MTGATRTKCLRCVANPEREECVEAPPIVGSINPRYLILTIVYAPPGTTGSGTRSSVEYSSSSTTGSATAIEDSFKAETETTASASFFGLLDVGGNFGAFTTSTSGRSIEVKKSQTEVIKVQGGAADGINHDADMIYLWLNPKVAILARDDNAQWSLGVNGQAMDITYVYVGWLKNPATMPPGVQQRLSAAGITADDYQQMLSQDPFASGGTAIDTNRYRQTNIIYPYEPPFDQGAPSPSWTTQIKNQTITSNTTTNVYSHWVGYSLGVSGPLADWLKISAKTTGKLTWTKTSKWSTSNDTSQAASLTITSPSFGYTGPTSIAVYWDTVYGSFMFAPAPLPTPSAKGKLLDASGKVAAHKEVVLTVGRKQWRTFTNMKGEYKFYGTPNGTAFLEAAGGKRERVLLRTKLVELGERKMAP